MKINLHLISDYRQSDQMSVNHIFRQLTAGISFNTKSFASDAQRFGLTKTPAAAATKIEKDCAAVTTELSSIQLPTFEAVREEV